MTKFNVTKIKEDVTKFTAIVKEAKEKYYSDPVQSNIIDGIEFSLFYPTKYDNDHIYNESDIAKAIHYLCVYMGNEYRTEFMLTFIHLLRICVEDFPMEFKYTYKDNEIVDTTRAGEILHELYNEYNRDLLKRVSF